MQSNFSLDAESLFSTPLGEVVKFLKVKVKETYPDSTPVVVNLNVLSTVPFLFNIPIKTQWVHSVYSYSPLSSGGSSDDAAQKGEFPIMENGKYVLPKSGVSFDSGFDWSGFCEYSFHGEMIYFMGVVLLSDQRYKHCYFMAGTDEKLLKEFIQVLQEEKKRRDREFIPHLIFTNDAYGLDRPDVGWDSVFLPDGMKEHIQSNIEGFFKAQDLYKKFNIPYKRGMILAGPPGSGKSSVLKVLASQYRQHAFFMYGFSRSYDEFEDLESLFRRAQALAPSVFILEDIDRVIKTDFMRQCLNLLDGMATSNGVLTIATSNNPQDLDPALIERPSRFDLVLRFDLPDADLRRKYLKKQLENFVPFDDEQLESIVQATNKYSMAMLQEIRTGALLESVAKSEDLNYGHVLLSLQRLSTSLKTAKKATGSSDKSVGFLREE